jgi:hypothetical protein
MQNAMRGIVRDVLVETAKYGLPGEHHFYIAFKTRFPGVILPQHLLEKYPDEMTIVLQNRFSDMDVREKDFSISLSFNQRLENLTIPFAAIIGFVDPSVQFGLQFEEVEAEAEASLPATAKSALPAEEEGPEDDDTPSTGGAKVVALDAFRKKS